MRKILITVLMVLSFIGTSMAQRERNYIYLFDCTSSMLGKLPNQLQKDDFKSTNTLYWEQKQYLKEEMERISDPSTTITVIPFHQTPCTPIAFERGQFKWSKIETALDQAVWESRSTGVCKSWDQGLNFLDPDKDNYFFVLTDGAENVDPRRGAAVTDRVRKWCESYPNSYCFYVALTPEAYNNCPGLKAAVDACSRVSIVTDHQGPFGCFNETVISINTNQLKPKALTFSADGEFDVKGAVTNDPYFSVSIRNNKISNGKMVVEFVMNQRPPSETYEFDFQVQSDPKLIQITNPTIHVMVNNADARTLDLASEQINGGKLVYYPSFLFSRAKSPDTLWVDLGANWNAAAKKNNSEAKLEVNCPDIQGQYQVFYNGQPLTDNVITMRPNDKSSRLGIVLDPTVPKGKYLFNLVKVGDSRLDLINDNPSRVYENDIRVKNIVRWNPLARGLFWLTMFLLAALLAWVLFLRVIFFPTYKALSCRISEPYFKTLKLKGVRKVVFSDKTQKQNPISRVFVGKVLYEVNPLWTKEWSLTPSVKRNSGRVVGLGENYSIDPFDATLRLRTEYTITKMDSGEKAKIELS